MLHAAILDRGPAEDRDDRVLEGAGAQGALDLCDGDLFVAEILFHDRVVKVGDGLDQFVAHRLRLFDERRGDLALLPDGTEGVFVIVDRLHGEQIDEAIEAILGAERQLNRHGPGMKPFAHRIQHHVKIGADPVHFVDISDAGDAVFIRLPPDRLRLGLDTAGGIEDGDCAIQNSQRTFDFGRKIDMAGRVDDVDAVVLPAAGDGGRGDGDASFAFLLHPVHSGGAVVNLAYTMHLAGVVQDPLGGGGLTGIDVSHDADIAGLFQRGRG